MFGAPVCRVTARFLSRFAIDTDRMCSNLVASHLFSLLDPTAQLARHPFPPSIICMAAMYNAEALTWVSPRLQ